MGRGVDNLFDWLDAFGEVFNPRGGRGAGFIGEWMVGEWIDREFVEDAISEAQDEAFAMAGNAGQEALLDEVFGSLSIDSIMDGGSLYEHASSVLGDDVRGIESIISEADAILGDALTSASMKSAAVGFLL